MTAEPLTCPYCNSAQPPRPGLAAGQRVTCARCGESFVVSADAVRAGPPLSVQAAPPAPTPALVPRDPVLLPSSANRRRGNRLIAGAVLAVMLLTGAVGLTYALLTVQTRRDHDKALPRKSRRPIGPGTHQEEPAAPAPATAPAQLAALGYLPKAANVVLGANVAELRADPRAKELITRPMKLGKLPLRLDGLPVATGLSLEEIDHVVLGAVLRSGQEADLTPPVCIVVRAATDYDQARSRKALKATRQRRAQSPDGVARTVHDAQLFGLPVTLWQPDARTLVLGLPNELADVPGRPHDGAAALPAEVRDALKDRLPGAPPLWAVGHSDNWKNTWLPTALSGLKDVPLTDRLDQVRSFVLSYSPAGRGRLVWDTQFASPAAAERAETEALQPRLKAQPGLKYARDGAWLTVQIDGPGK